MLLRHVWTSAGRHCHQSAGDHVFLSQSWKAYFESSWASVKLGCCCDMPALLSTDIASTLQAINVPLLNLVKAAIISIVALVKWNVFHHMPSCCWTLPTQGAGKHFPLLGLCGFVFTNCEAAFVSKSSCTALQAAAKT